MLKLTLAIPLPGLAPRLPAQHGFPGADATWQTSAAAGADHVLLAAVLCGARSYYPEAPRERDPIVHNGVPVPAMNFPARRSIALMPTRTAS